MKQPSFSNQNQQFGARGVTVEAKLISAGVQFCAEASAKIRKEIEPLKLAFATVEASHKMKNSLDGDVTVQVGGYYRGTPISFVANFKAVDGKLEQLGNTSAAFHAGLKAAQAVVASAPASTAVEIDLATIKAERSDHMIRFTCDSAPHWEMFANLEQAKTAEGREDLRKRMAHDIQSHLYSFLGKASVLKSTDFKFPVVASKAVEVQASAEVSAVEAEKEPGLEAGIEAGLMQHALTVIEAAQRPGSDYGQVMAANSAFEEQQGLRAKISAVVSQWVRGNLRGGNPTIEAMDFSGLQKGLDSKFSGYVIASVRYYSDKAVETVSLQVPVLASGQADAAKIGRTQADVLAEDERKKALQLKNEEEAKAEFEAFMAKQKALQAEQEKLGVQAAVGYGSNWIKQGPADMIPVGKAMLPADLTAGKKVLVDGYVYEIQATSFNSPSVEKSAYWMLKLRSDLGPKDVDHDLVYASAANVAGL